MVVSNSGFTVTPKTTTPVSEPVSETSASQPTRLFSQHLHSLALISNFGSIFVTVIHGAPAAESVAARPLVRPPSPNSSPASLQVFLNVAGSHSQGFLGFW